VSERLERIVDAVIATLNDHYSDEVQGVLMLRSPETGEAVISDCGFQDPNEAIAFMLASLTSLMEMNGQKLLFFAGPPQGQG